MKATNSDDSQIDAFDTAEHHEPVTMSEHDALLASDNDNASNPHLVQPTLPSMDILREVLDFASQHGLEDSNEILTKAIILIHPERPCTRCPDQTLAERTALGIETTSRWKQPFLMYLCIIVTALGAMGQGWAQTGINGANIYWPDVLGVGSESAHDSLVVGLINSGIYLSNALLGSWLVSPLNHRLGRRGAVFAGGLVSLLFNVASSIAGRWQILLLCRLLLGVGLGIVNSTLNIFAAECAPAAIRGGLGVAWQMFTAFGIFLGFLMTMLVDNAPETFKSLRWRAMLLAPAVPALPLLALIFVCPESPSYWVKHSGRYDMALRSLRRLRNTELQAARDLLVYHEESQRPENVAEESSYLKTLMELFTIPRVRRATVAAWTTMLAQQLCGINIVAFYSSTIFLEASFTPHAANLASTIFGLVNFLGAIPAIWTMDSLGRRSLLLLTLPLTALSMAVAATSFSISDDSVRFGMITSMIYLFCLLYSPGMGPVPAAYSAEVFPLSHRELGTSSAVAVTNLFAAILSLTFPALLSVLGTQGSFLVYALGNVVGWFLVFLFVRETKMRTLEELDEVFSIPGRRFIDYQLKEVVPWWTRRYILMRKNEMSPSGIVWAQYSAVDENE
ncbi:hypothetical protein DOTSEDRAFT_54893 [Dothistroma septosporum NZE10]|uniref:Major facilitator superfamily (MFS) profile domain-containing protein n=1 Tax=Dothistroma septosporum (strain NZE10 / CBS 128990) TaxID=675120 RepID=N1PKC2_DOTSN|nr:hypothetical protein DOTSEDRAFT_54893 [Dothistroma septosporum NZE10]